MIVFVVDASTGITPPDLEAAELLRRATSPVLVAVNKADNDRARARGGRVLLARLGRDVRDQRGPRAGDRRSARRDRLGAAARDRDRARAQGPRGRGGGLGARHGRRVPRADDRRRRVAGRPRRGRGRGRLRGRSGRCGRSEVGRGDRCRVRGHPGRHRDRRSPNVGKSSLLNSLLGEERSIVSEIPGTTRDAIDTTLAYGRSEVVLIDTAGMRRRGKVASGPAAERYSALRALRAIARADVAILVLDAVDGLTAQDAHVAGYVVEEGKGLVVAINKWDLLEEKTDRTFDEYVKGIRREVPFLDFAPVVSISAKTGQRVGRVLEAAVDVWGERRKRIPTGELNRLLGEATRRQVAAGRQGQAAEDLLRDPGRGRAADVRRLRPRSRQRPLQLPALPREPAARGVSASMARRSGSCSANGARSSFRAAGGRVAAAPGPARRAGSRSPARPPARRRRVAGGDRSGRRRRQRGVGHHAARSSLAKREPAVLLARSATAAAPLGADRAQHPAPARDPVPRPAGDRR